MKLYRVFSRLADAAEGAPGHPLHVPQVQGRGRLDNPGTYRVLYVADDPAAACAEAFDSLPVWDEEMFAGSGGSVRALATYELDGAGSVLDLDDAHELVRIGRRPSQVVTRDRRVTQTWAAAVHAEGRWQGVRWWSYHKPEWGALGLWDLGGLRVVEVSELRRDHPALERARRHLGRLWL